MSPMWTNKLRTYTSVTTSDTGTYVPPRPTNPKQALSSSSGRNEANITSESERPSSSTASHCDPLTTVFSGNLSLTTIRCGGLHYSILINLLGWTAGQLTMKTSKFFSASPTWSRRFVLLRGPYLIYYHSRSDYDLKPNEPINKRAIDITGYEVWDGLVTFTFNNDVARCAWKLRTHITSLTLNPPERIPNPSRHGNSAATRTLSLTRGEMHLRLPVARNEN